MTKGTKIGLIIGGLAIFTGGIVTYLYFKDKKEKEKLKEDLISPEMSMNKTPIDITPVSQTQVAEIDVREPAPQVPVDIKKLSYDRILNRFKSSPRTKEYADYFSYSISPAMLGLTGRNTGLAKDSTATLKFQKDGGWRLYLNERGKPQQFLTGGLFYKAGTKLVVYNGVNKGLIISGESPVDNAKRALTA